MYVAVTVDIAEIGIGTRSLPVLVDRGKFELQQSPCRNRQPREHHAGELILAQQLLC
eukprot:CAMPEP_0172900598 /NCGR_PEP_ID=MMETSP1075-20121228/164441_1 /TAXON_ID=2916 /ORGANISM="Ceratium fusus, Strain PA161109" /LENGTH=56 /DNA_ID=CAMNT_0013756815 /DNA_START=42 /DNA_END=209 /DNA_ORIENTATION=+